ncbi:AF4/FMR2 family member lilli-like [Cotesia glomerata]|uniref:Uncharacterized protein n=1 Tax=Cotesia glomerata TaxID=32391 RepID=A0AAV7IJ42_COTGL|nr:AF4/FMR2 family member lilli-like [Cotesia glomerata]KAH0554103.1 hypothetical protein KQX54_007618 [Cotesia glomerata]
MGKTRGVHETTPELRNRMVGMYEAGLGLREIAAAVNCSQRTVKRWLNRFDKEGTVETRERCGRKRATTTEQDAAIVRLATQTPITAAKAVLPALGLTCSVDTIRERLHKAGIHNWSPSRKHIQKIPLGDVDGAAIQQAVWRPTGTSLGKKKSQKPDDSAKKSGAVVKRKVLKKRAKPASNNTDTEESAASKQPQTEEPQQLQQQDQLNSSFNFQPDNFNQVQPRSDESPQMQAPSLMNSQSEFNNALSLVVSPQSMYQHHSGVDVTQNWPLDLGQNAHHYPQSQPESVALHQPSSQQHLQELHTPQEQEQHAHEQHMQEHNQSIQQLHHHQPQHHLHHHPFDEPHHQLDQIQSQLSLEPIREPSKVVRSNSCSNSSIDNSSDGDGELNNKDDYDRSRSRKKKGGKAKGTLETSVEIRNRMIGMSEAGLSTLSIALAINRSERTVKRWLERWNKEGNVQTKERKGRRRITTKEQDEAIVAMATQNPLTAAKHVAPALGLNCSVDTVRERLHKAGIHSWKLGKKQGEGNVVHTVHLWQPSGNRPNKPKITNNDSNERKKKGLVKKVNGGSSNVKRTSNNNNSKKKKKKKTDVAPKNLTTTTGSVVQEQNQIQQYRDNGGMTYSSAQSIMQPVHVSQAQSLVPQQPPIPAPLVSIPPPPPPPPIASVLPPETSVPHSMQPLGPIMQRPDCRMISSIPNTQNSGMIGYSSCMIGNNNHMDHQPDPLNYEPFIWTF